MRFPGRGAVQVPAALRGKPNRTTTTALRPWDWALPPRSVSLEVVSAVPDGWADRPRHERRPPILFVHGVGGGAWMFAEHWLGAAVRRGYPAHAVSLRGHGGSAGRDRWRTTVIRDYLDDILQTVIGLPQPPVLIGHGMGGLLVQLILERYPARAGVIVAAPPLTGRPSADAPDWRRLLVSGRWPIDPSLMFWGLAETTAQAHLRRMDREPPLVLLQLARGHRIGPVHSPVAVAGCQADRAIAPIDVRRTADAYGVLPMWLPGAGHLVMLDGSSSVGLDIILDWVDQVAGPSVVPRAAVRQ